MVKDLVMEFDKVPSDITEKLPSIQIHRRAMEDALMGIVTGLVELTGWMRA